MPDSPLPVPDTTTVGPPTVTIDGSTPPGQVEFEVYDRAFREALRLVTRERDQLRAELDAAPPLFSAWPKCPDGCGCRLGTEDADARECGCDGPCTTECQENGYPDKPSYRDLAVTAGTGRLLAEAARYKRERDEARAELAESNRLRAQSYDRLLDSGKQLADLDAAYKTLTAQCEVHHLARQSAESRLAEVTGERDVPARVHWHDCPACQRMIAAGGHRIIDLLGHAGYGAFCERWGQPVPPWGEIREAWAAAANAITALWSDSHDGLDEDGDAAETAAILADPDTMAAIAEGESDLEAKP
jgi:hypothetical protein